MERRCGTCKWFVPQNKRKPYAFVAGECTVPFLMFKVPHCILGINSIRRSTVMPQLTDCPYWEAKP